MFFLTHLSFEKFVYEKTVSPLYEPEFFIMFRNIWVWPNKHTPQIKTLKLFETTVSFRQCEDT